MAELRIEQLEERRLLTFGAIDGAYVVEPWHGDYHDVKIQPGDQKIVAAGAMQIANPDGTFDSRVAVARYDSLGNADTTYGSGGLSTPPLGPDREHGSSLVLQPDGKAVVSGTSGWVLGVARLNANGSPDSGFGNGGWNSFDVKPGGSYQAGLGVGLQSTGKIVVSGYEAFSTGTSAFVARFTASGAIDSGKGGFGQVVKGKATGATLSTFGLPNNYFFDLAIQPDNKVVAVGAVYDGNSGGSTSMLLSRYTASGALDTTFNGKGYSVFAPAGINYVSTSAMKLQSDGKIVVVGDSSGIDGAIDMFVARFNMNGTLDTGFGGGSGYVRLDIDGTATETIENGRDVVIQPDGKIVVVGSEYTRGVGISNVLVARLNTNGSLDGTFGAGGFKIGAPPAGGGHSFHGNAVGLQSDGSIIVAGYDNVGGPNADFRPLLMRFSGTQTSSLQAAGGAATASSHTKPLTLAQVEPLLTEAIARWQAAGVDVSGLGSLDVRMSDLPDATLGMASGNTIALDNNAAGWGWFVDSTPWNSSEFQRFGNQGEQDRMDLLTVVMHELGHLLGHDHDEAGVMAETLSVGVRRTDVEHDHMALVDQVFGPPVDQHAATLFGDLLDEQLDLRRLWFKRRR